MCLFQKIREELTRALVEETSQDGNRRGEKGSLESFDELVKEMTLKRRDIKTFASVTKKMVTLSNFSSLKKFLAITVVSTLVESKTIYTISSSLKISWISLKKGYRM